MKDVKGLERYVGACGRSVAEFWLVSIWKEQTKGSCKVVDQTKNFSILAITRLFLF